MAQSFLFINKQTIWAKGFIVTKQCPSVGNYITGKYSWFDPFDTCLGDWEKDIKAIETSDIVDIEKQRCHGRTLFICTTYSGSRYFVFEN